MPSQDIFWQQFELSINSRTNSSAQNRFVTATKSLPLWNQGHRLLHARSRRNKVSSSIQFQVTNFMSAMAGAIASDAVATPHNPELEDFSPNTSHRLECSPHELRITQVSAPFEYLRTWVPSVETLVANLALAPEKRTTENNSIRDFGTFIAQLESPSASAFETYDLHQIRVSLSERSLTFADFRHAVDQHLRDQ